MLKNMKTFFVIYINSFLNFFTGFVLSFSFIFVVSHVKYLDFVEDFFQCMEIQFGSDWIPRKIIFG